MKIELTEVKGGRLVAEHPSREEDCVLATMYGCSWRANGEFRRLTIAAGFRFFPGVQRMPLVAKLFLRLVGITKMLHSALPHDALYATQGGRRPSPLVFITGEDGKPVVVGRCEADLLAFRLSRAENVRPYFAKIIRFVLRNFGQDAWND